MINIIDLDGEARLIMASKLDVSYSEYIVMDQAFKHFSTSMGHPFRDYATTDRMQRGKYRLD